jgi:hypothetical protein
MRSRFGAYGIGTSAPAILFYHCHTVFQRAGHVRKREKWELDKEAMAPIKNTLLEN